MLNFLMYFGLRLNKVTKKNLDWKFYLFLLGFLELVVGGGGRIFDFGGITLRMLLFGSTQLVLWYHIFSRQYRPGKELSQLFLAFASVTAFSALWGHFRGAELAAIIKDVKPLLYWSNLLFYGMVIRDTEHVTLIKKGIKWSTVLMAALYLMILLLWRTKIIDGWAFYQWVRPTEEFFYRGSLGFFFKGFVFLPIGIFFWQKEAGFRKYLFIFVIYLAMLLTFTRGLWLLIFMIHLMYTVLFNYKSAVSWLLVVLMITSVFSVSMYVGQLSHHDFEGLAIYQTPPPSVETMPELKPWQEKLGNSFSQGFKNRQSSVLDRIIQIGEVAEAVTPASFFIGNGFGIGVPSRPVHMEISYLEIFHKQGLLGLSIWAWFFISLWKRFYRRIGKNLRSIDYKDETFAFFISAAFMFAISLTNPFINSPMGLGMLGIALVCLQIPQREVEK